MKKRYKILSIILAVVIALGSIVTISIFSSSAAVTYWSGGIYWTLIENGNGWAIKPKDNSKLVGSVTIPSEYQGKPINMIASGSDSFQCRELTEITIPDSIVTIESNSFSNCEKLTTINFGKGLKEINNAFSGCTSLTNITFPQGIERIGNFGGCTSLTSVTIPDSVTSLSLWGCTNLTSIDIPDNVTNLSFKDCTGLSSVTIPDSVTTISSMAFKGCTGLTSMSIPDSVTTIESEAFSGCTGLTSITIPDSVTTISSMAFKGCTSLTSVTIPDSVITIGESAFAGCTGLTSVDLGNGLQTIGKSAFESCTGLTSISIPDSVVSIGKSAFYNCTNLATIKVGKGIQTVGSNPFLGTAWYNSQEKGLIYADSVLIGYKGTKPTGAVEIKGGTTVISDNAFLMCSGITSVSIPTSVITIGESAFDSCTGLTSVTIPDNVITIGKNAFYGCKKIKSLTIPDSVTVIGNSAFYNCTNLATINLGSGIKSIGSNAFKGTAWYNSQTGLVYANSVLVGYNGTKPTGAIEIKSGTTIISGYVFMNCTDLTSIIIPDSVTTIGDSAFNGCTSLTSVTIPDSVTTIGANAFSGCTGLTSVDLGNGLQTIGDNAFYNTSITFLDMPDSVTSIGMWSFENCRKLESLKLSKNLKSINQFAFNRCTSLKEISIPNGVEIIDSGAFQACQGVEKIYISESVKSVESDAFRNIGLIEELITDAPLSVFDNTAFYLDSFKNVKLGSNVDSLGDEFANEDTLENIFIPNNVTNIKDTALLGSPNLTITTTPNSTAHDYATNNNIPVKLVEPVDATKNIDFEVTCDKQGYEFTVYRVADLVSAVNPYSIRYDSLIDSVDDEIFNGDSEGLLAGLDEVPSSELTEVVGTYSTDVDGASKLFEDLPAGIYYVRATNFPANVYSVQNSVFALPYYVEDANLWTYELSPIPLATKVDESDPDIVKTITNSTKDNVNFTDVSLGDTVNFEIEASRVGNANVVESKDFKLKSYVVSDIMENGLTLNQDSFVVTLEDIDGNTLATLDSATDYAVNIIANEGADTTFTVSLTPEYLQETEFYSSANVVIAYSAVLNEYSTREFDGNYNTATNLTYSNKTNVSATVDGNTVYAYTFGIEVNKYDDAGTPLAGSDFALYLTEEDAKAMKNEIATGTSTDTGKVEFFTADGDVIRLASGDYFIVETKSTENYNRYTDVIPVTISAEYGDTEVNGTYIVSAPENGIQLVEVKNSKVVIPNTGGDGAMYRYVIALAFAMLAVTLVVLKKRSSRKATVK